MAVKFNPFTGQLQIDEKGSGGGSSYIDGEVQNFSALPETIGSPAVDSAYLVREAEGTWLLNRKPAGIYIRTANTGTRASDWTYAGEFPDVFSDANFVLYDNGDSTRNLQFQLSGIDTATTRTLTAPNASGTIARTEDFAAPPAIGNTTPNSGAFTTLSANNGTLTASAPVLDLSQTWNNAAVTFAGMRLNVTNTASAAASNIAEFQVGGTSMVNITRDGFIGNANAGMLVRATGSLNRLSFTSQGAVRLLHNNSILLNESTGGYGWVTSGAPTSLSPDTVLFRDDAGVVGQHAGTSPQAYRLYNTRTDASNFERGFMRWSSNVLQIGTEKAGTGSGRNLELVVDGTTRMIIDTSGQVGIGNGVSLNRPFHIYGTTAWGRIDRVGTVGPAWLMVRMSTGQTVASSWLFGPLCGAGSTVAGVTDDDFAISDFGTSISGTAGTARLTISKSTGQLTVNGNLNLSTKDLVTDTTTGTKIGTGTTQKIGFFNATPVVQQAAIADATDAATTQARLNDLLAVMRTFGLIAT